MESRVRRIKSLCQRMLISENPEEVHALASDLQAAIHEHIEALRLKIISRMGAVPSAIEAVDSAKLR
jgi:hypothetical protein